MRKSLYPCQCSAAVFMVDDIDMLEQLNVKIIEIHELVQTISVNDSTGDMPITKQWQVKSHSITKGTLNFFGPSGYIHSITASA